LPSCKRRLPSSLLPTSSRLNKLCINISAKNIIRTSTRHANEQQKHIPWRCKKYLFADHATPFAIHHIEQCGQVTQGTLWWNTDLDNNKIQKLCELDRNSIFCYFPAANKMSETFHFGSGDGSQPNYPWPVQPLSSRCSQLQPDIVPDLSVQWRQS